MPFSSKKLFLWSSCFLVLGLLLAFFNEFFFRDWRIQQSKERVQQSSLLNFQQNREHFIALRDLLRELDVAAGTRIEGLEGNQAIASASSSLKADTSILFYLNNNWDSTTVVTIQDGAIKVQYADTLVEIQHWMWDFEGTTEGAYFQVFLEAINMTKPDFTRLMQLVAAIDGEAIAFQEDKRGTVRFDGIPLYQYEYLFTDSAPTTYQQLEEGIYTGLHDSGLFCGHLIFSK